jgi:ABC-type transport system substrate-binding protein
LAQAWSQANIPGLNPGAYVNKELEKLYDQSNHPPCDLDSRKKIFQKIQSTLANDVPYIFLSSRTGYTFLNSRVVPNEPTPLGIRYRPEKWYLLSP